MINTHHNAKVLIVDDQDANLRLLERILKQGGFNWYRSISDSRQVIAAYQEFQPDLVLLDLMMPHLDGLAILELLRPLVKDIYLPVLVLTADVTPEARRHALNAGAKDFLTKPLDVVEVLLRVKNLLETRILYQQFQERANKQIQEQAALLDLASDAIMVHDLEERILYWNQGAERMYGRTRPEFPGQDARPLLNNATALNRAIQSVLNEGRWQGKIRQTAREGPESTVADRSTQAHNDKGRPTSRPIINTDSTGKKSLQAQDIDTGCPQVVDVASAAAHPAKMVPAHNHAAQLQVDAAVPALTICLTENHGQHVSAVPVQDGNGGALPPAARAFLDDLLHLRLLTPHSLSKFLDEHADRLPNYAAVEILVADLLRENLLTEYQHNRITSGNSHGLVLGNHKLLRKLGAGGMGVVYFAEHLFLHRTEAVKVLPVDDDCPSALLNRFYSEMQVLAELRHPSIVTAYDAGQEPSGDSRLATSALPCDGIGRGGRSGKIYFEAGSGTNGTGLSLDLSGRHGIAGSPRSYPDPSGHQAI